MRYILRPYISTLDEKVIQNINGLLPRLERVEPYFEGHLRRACYCAFHFGKKIGLSEEELRRLYLATFFHDVGKIHIPPEILNKCGPLSPAEFKIMESHPLLGGKVCRQIGLPEEVAALVEYHHEKLDGTGYPRGIQGNGIPVQAWVLATIEIYDALRSERCYKESFPIGKSLELLAAQAETGKLEKNIVSEFSKFIKEMPIDPDGITEDFFTEGLQLKSSSINHSLPPERSEENDGVTVLVVDDTADLREIITLALEKKGYQVIDASGGAEALQRLEEKPIDIVLLDIMMPKMDGFEVCRRMRENPAFSNVYVIFLSAKDRYEDRVKGLQAGGNDYLVKPFYFPELMARIKVGETTLLKRRELALQASRDSLTALFNRRAFSERLVEEFERSKRYGRPMSVLMIDIDDFKKVNDSYGHDIGDTVLKKIAGVLRARTRKNDTACRFGGEEFVVLLPEVTLQGAVQAGVKLCEDIKKLVFSVGERTFYVTVSVGAASSSEKSYADPWNMVSDADVGLYRAKASGKDCVKTYEDGGQKMAESI